MERPDPIPGLKRALGEQLAPLIHGWSAGVIAAWLETDRSRVADLRRGDLRRFSLETLIRFTARMGYEVELHTRKLRANEPRG